jgi:hypothetical protein
MFLRKLYPYQSGGSLPARLGFASAGVSKVPAMADHVHDGLFAEQVLFSLIGANMNAITDQSFVKSFIFNKYRITRAMIFGNNGTSLTAAAGGIYTGAGKTGSAIVAASQAYAAITAAEKGMDATLVLADRFMAAPILSLTTAQGSAATADFYLVGVPLS